MRYETAIAWDIHSIKLVNQDYIQSTLSLLYKRRELMSPPFTKGDIGGLNNIISLDLSDFVVKVHKLNIYRNT